MMRARRSAQGEQFKPGFTSINPKSKVPTLVADDGTVMTEFPAIAFWLARTNPSPICCRTMSICRRGAGTDGLLRRHHPHAGILGISGLPTFRRRPSDEDAVKARAPRLRRKALPYWTRRWRARNTRSALSP